MRGLDSGEEYRAALERQRALHLAEQRAQQDERARLILTAPFAGQLVDIDPELAAGVWVNPQTALAWLIASDAWQVELFVDQDDLARIELGADVRFYIEGEALYPMRGQVIDIATTRTAALPLDLLSSEHGGPIPLIPNATAPTPRDALYRIRVALADRPRT
ncbi:putative peptide zinc metalloprotease protein [Allochromatium warmingii]|uniref:Putative peptide zinc metalloprotease protein n=1 Tax=Allochromatium warmingii TaxID=61595 RepID=A0A1H3GN21_ALLWA|nr:HlyD family secretion protein [Allochromatium warmingii]SDY03904.1 putative peptide zinc metalloprotease protein [Allochromatium warmingii]